MSKQKTPKFSKGQKVLLAERSPYYKEAPGISGVVAARNYSEQRQQWRYATVFAIPWSGGCEEFWATLCEDDITASQPEEDERLANAHLIAAAPEMYDALYWLLHLASGVSKGGHDYPITEREWAEAVEAGKDAIAKAKGEKA